jgi:MSHA biogenesis protein MshG
VPAFAYRGRTSRGELVTGTIEAADPGAVADQLMNTGVTPVDIRATAGGDKQARGPGFFGRLFTPKVSLVDSALFSRQMYTLLRPACRSCAPSAAFRNRPSIPRCAT